MPVISRLVSIPLRISEIAFGAVSLSSTCIHNMSRYILTLSRLLRASSDTFSRPTMRFNHGHKVDGSTPKLWPVSRYYSVSYGWFHSHRDSSLGLVRCLSHNIISTWKGVNVLTNSSWHSYLLRLVCCFRSARRHHSPSPMWRNLWLELLPPQQCVHSLEGCRSLRIHFRYSLACFCARGMYWNAPLRSSKLIPVLFTGYLVHFPQAWLQWGGNYSSSLGPQAQCWRGCLSSQSWFHGHNSMVQSSTARCCSVFSVGARAFEDLWRITVVSWILFWHSCRILLIF